VGTRPGRRRTAALLALLAAVLLPGPGRAQLSPLSAPALPPQPGTAPAACSAASDTPGSFRLVTGETGQNTWPSYEVTEDPWIPCRLFRASDVQHVERSTDGGHSWQPVFADSVMNATTMQGFAAGALAPAGGDGVVIGERGNGDAVVRSGDGGASWQLGSGLAGSQVVETAFAPSNPQIGYAVVATATCNGLVISNCTDAIRSIAHTQDGGRTWTLPNAPVPAADGCLLGEATSCRQLQLSVDPVDPNHAAALIGQSNAASAILVTHDGGTSWAPFVPKGGSFTVSGAGTTAIAVTSLPDLGHVLYTLVPQSYVTAWDDDSGVGISSNTVSASLQGEALAVDPARPERLLVAGTASSGTGSVIKVLSSDDSFTSNRVGTSTLSGLFSPSISVVTPMWPTQTPLADALRTLQYDRQGGVLLAVDESCFTGPADCAKLGWAERQSYWHLVPVAPPPPPPAGGAGSPNGGGGGGGLTGGGGVGQPLMQLAACPLIPGPGAPVYGNLAFDGEHLLYTYDDAGPNVYTAVIHKLDPVTCLYAGDIDVQLDPHEFPSSTTAYIDEMTYDSNHNQVIAALSGSELVAVTVTRRGNGLRTPDLAVAHPLYTPACTNFLTYDFSDDTIWGCSVGSNYYPGHVDRSGRAIPSCLDAHQYYPGTWVLGNAGHLYLQYEDDLTVQEMNDRTCALGKSYTHRIFLEPSGEDEQLACDSVTFGASSHHTPPTTVLWLRDAEALTVTAYAITDGVCPFPTALAYRGDATVSPGQQATLCATLSMAGQGRPLANQRVDFTLGGAAVGSATTAADGSACIQPVVTLPPATYAVDAAFAGTAEYHASAASGSLTVLGVPPPPPLHQQAHGFVPPPPPAPLQAAGPPLPAAQPPAPATQVQLQPAPQTGPVPQSASAPQPVASAQRERQMMPAFAYAVQPQEDTGLADAYEMSRLPASVSPPLERRASLAGATAALLAGMTAGFAWMLRAAPAAERDRRRQRRRRPRRG
jgi:hypothetical protein